MIMAMKPERAAEIHEQQALSQNKVGGTRLDRFLAKIAGEDVGELTPKTNTERMLAKIYGDPAMSDIAPKTATEMALDAVAMQYDKMLIPDGSLSITENGTYNVADKETAEVNVPNPSTGSLSITENGTHDVKDYASAEVSVPAPSVEFAGINITNNTEETVKVVNSLVIDGGKLKTQEVDIAPNGEGMASVDYGAYGVNVFYRLWITIMQGASKTYAISPANGTACSILYQGTAGNHKSLMISVEKSGVTSMDKFPAITITEDK